MTNDERELVEMMAKEGNNSYFEEQWEKTREIEKRCWRDAATAMLSVVKANIGKIAEVCPACGGMAKFPMRQMRGKEDVFFDADCETCHGSGVVKKGE
jgi:DnaJ-class molecular chaperone